ncbi:MULTISPECIES: DNA cytosine methyltransferase [unclassified Rhizobium]|uniref:DNA cytosine methyltransferase n=1 Tax=unclassified Rhizobium TaxID=2613769 RepID=UPI003823B5A2
MALRPEHLNILSICTGGAGLDLGVELAIQSARTVCMVEREAFAVATLVSAMEKGLLHPAPIWSDARTFNGRAWRGAVDGLIGGIPCQPHSLAGRKQGSNDARDLWSTARRIIVQSGAWFVVIENVGGMLAAGSDEIAGAQRVFRDLHKLGFETEGGLFTAEEVGDTQGRQRIFILAVASTSGAGLEGRQRGRPFGQWDGPAALGSIAEFRSVPVARTASDGRREGIERYVATKAKGRAALSEASSRDLPVFPPGPGSIDEWRSVIGRAPWLEPSFRRVADGLASRMDIGRVDRLRMLGNGVVPLQAAYALRTLATRLVRLMEGIEA